jgi:hypothetical protein
MVAFAATAALAAAGVYRDPGGSDMPLEQRKVLITGGGRASDSWWRGHSHRRSVPDDLAVAVTAESLGEVVIDFDAQTGRAPLPGDQLHPNEFRDARPTATLCRVLGRTTTTATITVTLVATKMTVT